MIVAEFRIVPLGQGPDMEKPLKKVEECLKDSGVRYEMGPMGTTLEAETAEDVFNVVRACHTRLRGEVDRILTTVTLDERMDKRQTMESLSKV